MSLLGELPTHSSEPSPSRFTPRPLILVQRARASSLNSEVENLTRAVEQKVSLVKRSLPSLPQSPRSESQITYLRNGRPLIGQNIPGSCATPLPTPPVTPDNKRTFNRPHTRTSSHRRIHPQAVPLASPLSTDITNSLLFVNDATMISDPLALVDHSPGRPMPSGEISTVQCSDLLSEASSSGGEGGSQARYKGALTSLGLFLATVSKQEETAASDDILNSESHPGHKVSPPSLYPQSHGAISVLKQATPITAQQTTDFPATKDEQTSDAGRKRSTTPSALGVDVRRLITLPSTSFTCPDSPRTSTRSPSLRSATIQHGPPTPSLRPLKPLPLRPVTRKPPPVIPVELLSQTSPTDISTVAFPSSTSSPVPPTWSALDSRSLSPASPLPLLSSHIPHRAPSSRITSRLEPVIEVPFLERRGRFPSFGSTKESRSRQRRSTSFEALRRRPIGFLGLNKSTPDLRVNTSSTSERAGKGRDSPRARILSLGLLRRPRTGSKSKLSISSPLHNPPSTTTDTSLRLSTPCTSSNPQDSSPPTPSPTIYKRSSSSLRRWTSFVVKLFEPSSSSRPSSPSAIASSSRFLPPSNTNLAPYPWGPVPPVPPVPLVLRTSGKPNNGRLPHGRSFSQGTDSPSRKNMNEANASGFCLPAGVDPGRRPSLP